MTLICATRNTKLLTKGDQMFGISGLGLASLASLQNGGKRNRYNVGRWEEVRQLFIACCGDIPLTVVPQEST